MTNDTITSLAVHLLELTVSYPQSEYSGKEVAVSHPWLMVHEPVDLLFDSWFPTDFISANLRHSVTAIFSHPAKEIAQMQMQNRRQFSGDRTLVALPPQSMEIDRLESDEDSTTLLESSEAPGGSSGNAHATLTYNAPLALTGPTSNSLVPSSATSGDLVPLTRRQRQRKGLPTLDSSTSDPDSSGVEGGENSGEPKRTVINVNESIITLLLQLHSKYSNRPDSYVPQRQAQDHLDSRIGDGSFFIEKVLDKICNLDQACAETVNSARQSLWPDYHEDEAKKDAERERLEAEAKKRKAKERQRQMMEQLAQQRKRFMAKIESTTGGGENLKDFKPIDEHLKASNPVQDTLTSAGSSSVASASSESHPGQGSSSRDAVAKKKATEYTCCHCLQQSPAIESRPIGLVALIQSSSVLAHKHESTNHLILPISEEDESTLPPSWSDSLGLQYDELFAEMKETYDSQSCLLSVHRGWKSGIHIQSCGHHMHYDCRSSYCETLRTQSRGPRELNTLEFDRGDFYCPMCRQVANALLPVPPDAPDFPLSSVNMNINSIGAKISDLLGEETVLMSPDGPLRSEMTKIVEVFSKTASGPQPPSLGGQTAMFISSIARTNLECDIVQRGGTLVQGRGFAEMVGAASTASSSGATPKASFDSNRNKFCFGIIFFF